MNYKHLHYFWVVAQEGSIAKASKRLDITPQTISGQLSLLDNYFNCALFNKVGRNIELTDIGKQVLIYADEIFSIGDDLDKMMKTMPNTKPELFRVGVVDVVPKLISQKLLLPVVQRAEPTKMICREADLNTLLIELSLHRLDLVITDSPIPPTVSTGGYSHLIGSSSISFFATEALKSKMTAPFPQCLNQAPMMMPTRGNQLRTNIEYWLDKHSLTPNLIAEFDDSALMKSFGQQGIGIFCSPSVIQKEIMQDYKVSLLGETDKIQEEFYAITIEKKINNPITQSILTSANLNTFITTLRE
jgi:LysR family transcriptional activator of nhaA